MGQQETSREGLKLIPGLHRTPPIPASAVPFGNEKPFGLGAADSSHGQRSPRAQHQPRGDHGRLLAGTPAGMFFFELSNEPAAPLGANYTPRRKQGAGQGRTEGSGLCHGVTSLRQDAEDQVPTG